VKESKRLAGEPICMVEIIHGFFFNIRYVSYAYNGDIGGEEKGTQCLGE
jgi:hypothetical protein